MPDTAATPEQMTNTEIRMAGHDDARAQRSLLVAADRVHVPAVPRGPAKRTRKRIYAQQGRFSRRLQLAPGLVPPTSWSLSPCTGPEIHWRAKSLKSPG
jgi:hypothetical protein